MDISSIGGGAAVLTAQEASRSKLAKDLDSFLQLLTSQLKNQDPLSPMDSTEFTNQLVQFAQVEQAINSNESLTNLIGLTQQSIATSAVNYMGKTVEANSNGLPLQDGFAKFAYSIDKDAQAVSVVIRDAAGSIVYSATGEKTAGFHSMEWDGKDANGIQLEDGTYKVEVSALAKANEEVNSYTTVFGKVTGITSSKGETLLVIDKLGVPLTKILSITA